VAERLAGKRCLVTGGSRNLGRAIGCAFARAGAQVAFTYHKDDDAAAQARQAIGAAGQGREVLVFKGSVADRAHAELTVAEIVRAWGGLDVLVCNAAITQILPVSLVEEADWDQVLSVNLKGAFLFARAALKPMIRQKRGHILSMGAFGDGRVVHAPVHYAASKSALAGFTEALARDVGRHGIRVNLLQPGLLEAGIGTVAPPVRLAEYLEQHPAGRVGRLDEIAEAAVWLVSDDNTYMTGARIAVDGGA
jgi:3-oxoacyl-[acyl-carrier protein] reductase